MVNKIAGWTLFFILLFSSIIPVILLTLPPLELKCSYERRMGHNNKYQPATIYVRVCEMGR